MTILAVSENQGAKTSIFDKNDLLHFGGGQNSQTMSSKQKH